MPISTIPRREIMRASTKFVVAFAAVLFVVVLGPRAATASTANCPQEPRSNVPIGDGEVLQGTNCELYAVGDIDSFVFTGTSGNTYQIAAAVNGGSDNICLTLYNPSFVVVFSACTS